MQDGSIDKKELVYTNCTICGSDRRKTIRRIVISPLLLPSYLVRCTRCGLFYANPRLSKGAEEEYYKKRYHEVQEDGYWYKTRIDLFKRAIDIITKHTAGKRLIDVGCGMGYFMDLAKKNGWEAKGVEISETASEYAAEQLKLDVRRGNLEDAGFDAGYFDVATMWNVLDQIYDPRALLIETNRILKEGGYVFIRVSNLSFHLMLSRILNLLKSFIRTDINSISVFHLYSFDKNSIKNLLEATGFSDCTVKRELLDAMVPCFVDLFGRREKAARSIFNAAGRAIDVLTLGRVLLTPSMFAIARKNSSLRAPRSGAKQSLDCFGIASSPCPPAAGEAPRNDDYRGLSI